MRVTLVVDSLRPPLGGIGRYTWELCKRVPRQAGVQHVDFYDGSRFVSDPAVLLRNDSARSQPWLPRWARKRIKRRRLQSGLIHGPNYFLPKEAETGIITVHDLSVFRYPETHPAERVRAFEREFLSSIARASHIITDTQTVREEIAADFSVSEDRISVVPLGVDERFRPRSAEELQPLTGLGLQAARYALCVSTLEPRKKIIELIRAWGRLPQDIRAEIPLVLAGSEGWLNQDIHDMIRDGLDSGWLKHLGFVADETLPLLYSGAALFLYPSIYEGFGLPPIEAMASGVPVLVSNRSCLPEICGDAAAYIDPDDAHGFAGAIAASLRDSDWRARAREAGLLRAATYDWETCAEQTVAVYRRFSG